MAAPADPDFPGVPHAHVYVVHEDSQQRAAMNSSSSSTTTTTTVNNLPSERRHSHSPPTLILQPQEQVQHMPAELLIPPPTAGLPTHRFAADGVSDLRIPTAALTEPIRNEDTPSPSAGYPGTGTESEDSEDDDVESGAKSYWRPIIEDKSMPCEDEMAYIESREEHSALDHDYWQKQTFSDFRDPEIRSGENGRIDWTIEAFNGTSESPNLEVFMRSPIVRIGGYDWRIKFFPRGDETDFLSVYIECVTMQGPDFDEFEEFQHPPFPLLSNIDNSMLKKRRTVAAEISVIMYNPAEPRGYDFKSDAHQFHKRSNDYGWRYFSRDIRSGFHYRQHGQRQAILRDDRLALAAHIRIVHDPTNCMWQHTSPMDFGKCDVSVITTGLRPFVNMWPQLPAAVALFHFGPFRDFLIRCRDSTRQVHALQELLLKFYSRRISPFYGQRADLEPDDAVGVLKKIAKRLRAECDPSIVSDLIGSFEQAKGAVIGSNRLRTKDVRSIQAAVNKHVTPIETPAMLTLELQRQEFNRERRTWIKLTNQVFLDDMISVRDVRYVLFAFGTHAGDLQSNRHAAFVRPSVHSGLWYGYLDGEVKAMTHQQALEARCGVDHRRAASRPDSPLSGIDEAHSDAEVAYVVMYVREDVAAVDFNVSREEFWDPPDLIKLYKSLPPESDEKLLGIPWSSSQDGFDSAFTNREEGAATPLACEMDGEDVIMSDVEDDAPLQCMAESVLLAETATEPSIAQIWTNVVDGLGQDYYEGQMLGKQRHGDGHLISMNGNEYVGSFKAGKPHGYGTMTYSKNGDIYEGEWVNGEHHGQGKLTERATNNIYSGGWKEGKKHGSFVMHGIVSEEERGCCTICYDNEITTAFYDCGHVVACKSCASMVDKCPVCRKRVVATLQLYGIKVILE